MKAVKKTLQILVLFFSSVQVQAHSEYIDSLENVLPTLVGNERVDILNQLAISYRDNNVALSWEYSKQALRESRSSNYKMGEANALKTLSILHRHSGSLDTALHCIEDAIRLDASINNKYGLATAYLTRAHLYAKFGEPATSVESCIFALNTISSDSVDNKKYDGLRSKLWNQMSKSFRKIEDYKQAESASLQAIDFAKTSDNPDNLLASAYINYANLVALTDSSKELLLRKESIKLYERSSNKRAEAKALFNLAGWYNNHSFPIESTYYYFDQALAIRKYLNDSAGIANIYLYKGSIEFDNNEFEASKRYLEEAYRIGLENNFPETQEKGAEFLEKLYKATGQTDKEIHFRHVHDTLLLYSKENQLQASKPAYEFAIQQFEARTDSLEANKLYLTNQAANQTKISTLQKWVIVIGGAFILGLILFLRSQIKKRKATEQLRLKEQELHQQEIEEQLNKHELETVHTALESQEKERQRIAADLHDRLGSMLSTVKLQMDGLEDQIDGLSESNTAQFQHTGSLLDETITEVRKISHNMASGILMKFGLIPALENLGDNVEMTGKLNVETTLDELPERLPNQVELSLYRISQEVISNCLKHANATSLSISLHTRSDEIVLIIEDDGIGFDPEQNSDGLGLRNIASRVHKLQGTLNIDSVIGRGTITEVTIPLTNQL